MMRDEAMRIYWRAVDPNHVNSVEIPRWVGDIIDGFTKLGMLKIDDSKPCAPNSDWDWWLNRAPEEKMHLVGAIRRLVEK